MHHIRPGPDAQSKICQEAVNVLSLRYIVCREDIMKKTAFFAALLMLRVFTVAANANASSVEITAPDHAAIGSSITISVHVSHSSNNILHYTDWVWVKINDVELSRWDFTWNRRPESNNFVREVTFVVKGPLKITAKANCNIHGSAGERSHPVKVD
jgi:desulfoferrodoxin (superoxide reductase-like protein)